MGLDSHTCRDRPRERLRLYLRRQYQGAHQVKALARDIECLPKTAENILDGHWPSDTHLGAIVRRFGRDVLDAVFAPEIEPVLARLTQEQRELEEALEAVRARRRQAAGGLDGTPQRVVATEGRAFSSNR